MGNPIPHHPAMVQPNPSSGTPAPLARLLEDDHLRRPTTLFRDLPDLFMGDTDDADLQTILRMSLMEHVRMAYPAPRFQFGSQLQEQSIGATAAHPISVDDEAMDGASNDSKPVRSSKEHQVSQSSPGSRDEEFQIDMEEAIRMSLLESADDPYQMNDVASKKEASGATSSNPVWLGDDEDAIEDGAMDRKPAAVIVRPVSTENE
jgi:hypothetical protein